MFPELEEVIVTSHFTKLPWPGDVKVPFGFRVKLPPVQDPLVYHTRWSLYTLPFNAERQARNL